jgi:hypothetical protein
MALFDFGLNAEIRAEGLADLLRQGMRLSTGCEVLIWHVAQDAQQLHASVLLKIQLSNAARVQERVLHGVGNSTSSVGIVRVSGQW